MDKNINLELWFLKKTYVKFAAIICQNQNLKNIIQMRVIKYFVVNDVVVILKSSKIKKINWWNMEKNELLKFKGKDVVLLVRYGFKKKTEETQSYEGN